MALNMNKEALHVAKEALKLTPHHPRALTFVGAVLQRAGELEKARKAFETALSKDAKSVEAILALCSVFCQQKKYSVALQHLERYLPYHNTDWMHTRIGDIYMLANGDLMKAHHHYQIALSINPDYEKAKEGVGKVENALNREKEENDEDGDATHEQDVDFDMTAEEF